MPLPPFSPDPDVPTKPVVHEAGLDDVFVYLRRNVFFILGGLATGLLLGLLVQFFTYRSLGNDYRGFMLFYFYFYFKCNFVRLG